VTDRDEYVPPPAPDDLGERGRRLWERIVSTYELRADELEVLDNACREADLIQRIENALRGADLIVLGSMKQRVANPLVSEIRMHRQVLASLLRQLRLPDVDADADEDDLDPSVRRVISWRARRAARARWA
jgi:hypothetical protein